MKVASVLALTAVVATGSAVPTRAPTAIEDLAWMAGHWEGSQGTTVMEEVWLEPRGGVMIGMHRDVFGEGRFFFEHLMIEETDDGLVYYASPRGRQPPTPFRLTAQENTRVVFTNPDHDFPRSLTYELTDNGELHVAAAGEENGQRVLQSWTWARKVAR